MHRAPSFRPSSTGLASSYGAPTPAVTLSTVNPSLTGWPSLSATRVRDYRRMCAQPRKDLFLFRSRTTSNHSTSRLQQASFSTNFGDDRILRCRICLRHRSIDRLVSQRLYRAMAGRPVRDQTPVPLSKVRSQDFGNRERSDLQLDLSSREMPGLR